MQPTTLHCKWTAKAVAKQLVMCKAVHNAMLSGIILLKRCQNPSQLLLQVPEEKMLTFLRRKMTSFSDTLVDLEWADARVFCHMSTT